MDARQLASVFEQVARPARKQLQRDRDRVADVRIARFLAYLEEHLFAARFSVRDAFRSLGLRDNNISTMFCTQIGESPRAYLNRLRFETAVRLLCEGVPVWQIGQLIGFETSSGFCNSFLSYSDISPGRFQQIATSVAEMGSQASPVQIESVVGNKLSAAARRGGF